ncbi:SGNH/GDSL hydrolase family protein [Sagittula salina]|uniref:SGNH/GDSL hydrolase family protein n=1 Tax=Sagittula salina TaxID=2820268 RepID=A0A940MME3_9RHOB|nr:SGNH/GDSL hydrolase family protein [Sagittula salina]MBP0482218.1 SGNH/GDSL hydrolase family protein [Sagittula salina]
MAEIPTPITESELRRRLMDPSVPDSEIAPYLMEDTRGSRGFDPVIVPNPALVTPSMEEGAVLMSSANRIARWRRDVQYKAKLRTWDGPKLVSEGDSWFQYPILLSDVIDHLGAHYAIRSLGAAGDLVADIVAQDELIATVAAERPDGVLISGGGNDLLGEGRLVRSLRPYDPALGVDDYLTQGFETALHAVITDYRGLLHRLVRGFPGLPVLIHGYDHAIPARGKWLGRPMQTLGILAPGLQRALVARMVDRFYDALTALVDEPGMAGQVGLVDCRSVVKQWHDELHPTSDSYARVAGKFREALRLRGSALEGLRGSALEGMPGAAPGSAGPAGLEAAAQAAAEMAATMTDAALEAEIGRRALLTSAEPERALPMAAIAPLEFGALEGVGDTFRDTGQRILRRLNRELHGLMCGAAAADKAEREALAKALGLGDAAVAAALVQLLVVSFGLSPAVAAVVAAVMIRRLIRPTLEEICAVWGDSLTPVS